MLFQDWLAKLRSHSTEVSIRRRARRARRFFERLSVEQIEPRVLLTAPGDTLATARTATFGSNNAYVTSQIISGPGVELYAVQLTAGQQVTVEVDAALLDDGLQLSDLQ